MYLTVDSLTKDWPPEQRRIQARCVHPTGTALPYTPEEAQGSLLVRFARIVRTFGDRPALQQGERRVSYFELDAASNRLAHALVAAGGREPEPVALLFGLDINWAVAVLAVWKAGKHVLSLDPAYPPARLTYMIEDAGAKVAVTPRMLAQRARELLGDDVTILILEDVLAMSDFAAAHPPDIAVGPDSLVYIGYTSGSTGQPKGTLELHRNIVHMLIERGQLVQASSHDRLGLYVTGWIGGSISTTCFALFNGGCLTPFDFQAEGLVGFERWLVRDQITVVVAGPILRAWLPTLDESSRQRFPHLRAVLLGAGPTLREHVEGYQLGLGEHCILANFYSCTEVRSIGVYFADHMTELEGRAVPSGYSPPWATLEVWDDNRQPLPHGQVGELVVFTPYTAAGYWHQPELSAEKFGVDVKGRRYYRTGDLGQVDADGRITVWGRRDGQTKIRSHRIETAEIESAILDYPTVGNTVVLVRGDTDENRFLVAFVEPLRDRSAPGTAMKVSLDSASLRTFLATRLPAVMIPTHILVLDHLPRNTSNKLDRVRLATYPLPDMATGDRPRTPVERDLMEMAAGLLHEQEIGRDDNFFEVGGQSILAARLLLAVKRRYGVDVSPRHFFAKPSVAGLAQFIEGGTSQLPETETLLVEVQPGEQGQLPFFLCLGGGGSDTELLWYGPLLRQLGHKRPIYALLGRGGNGKDAPYATVSEMVDGYLEITRTVQPQGPYVLGGECIGAKLAHLLAQRLEAAGERVARLVLLDPSALTNQARSTWRYLVRHSHRRVLYHLDHVRQLPLGEGAAYVRHRATMQLPPLLGGNPTVQRAIRARRQYRSQLTRLALVGAVTAPTVMIVSHESNDQGLPAQWAPHLLGPVDTHVVPGDHRSYLGRHVAVTGSALAAHLNQAYGTGS